MARNNSAYFAFLGVPYADPPTGEFRFRPPNKVEITISFCQWQTRWELHHNIKVGDLYFFSPKTMLPPSSSENDIFPLLRLVNFVLLMHSFFIFIFLSLHLFFPFTFPPYLNFPFAFSRFWCFCAKWRRLMIFPSGWRGGGGIFRDIDPSNKCVNNIRSLIRKEDFPTACSVNFNFNFCPREVVKNYLHHLFCIRGVERDRLTRL